MKRLRATAINIQSNRDQDPEQYRDKEQWRQQLLSYEATGVSDQEDMWGNGFAKEEGREWETGKEG